MSGRTLVTGLGVVAPNGITLEQYWKNTLAGGSALTPITAYDPSRYAVRLAGRVTDFDPARHIPGRLMPQTDRVTRLALYAAEQALADAGVDPSALPEYGMGVVTSNATGGFEFTHTEIRKLWTKGPQFVSVYESFAWFYAVNTGQISIRHGMRGPSGVIVAEQAGGLDAVGQARRNLRREGLSLAVTGGVESSLDPWGWVSHIAHGRLSTEPDPERAYRPFAADAGGYVPGEGGAILVLEDEETVGDLDRCHGEVAGYAATFDPAPDSGRGPTLAQAARLALADAGVRPDQVDVVFADAAGTVTADRQEAQALVELFGPAGVPVSAPKGAIGRLVAGGPPLDLVAALLAMRDGVIPPTAVPVEVPAEYRIDLVTDEPRPAAVRTALVLARGLGGFNSAVVLRAVGAGS